MANSKKLSQGSYNKLVEKLERELYQHLESVESNPIMIKFE